MYNRDANIVHIAHGLARIMIFDGHGFRMVRYVRCSVNTIRQCQIKIKKKFIYKFNYKLIQYSNDTNKISIAFQVSNSFQVQKLIIMINSAVDAHQSCIYLFLMQYFLQCQISHFNIFIF